MLFMIILVIIIVISVIVYRLAIALALAKSSDDPESATVKNGYCITLLFVWLIVLQLEP